MSSLPFIILIAFLLGSLALFIHPGYQESHALQLAGLAVMFMSFLVVLALPAKANSRQHPDKKWSANGALLGAFILIYIAIFSFTVCDAPSWSEESGWIEIAKAVAQGEQLNPVTPKSDYPSSIQAWPIALLLRMTGEPLPSSRLAGLLYSALSLVVLCACVKALTRADRIPVLPAILGGFSTVVAFYAHMGWHEITPVPLLILATWYCFLKVCMDREESFLRWFALMAGLSAWTLYTPALAAFILILIFLCNRTFGLRSKLQFVLSLLVIIAPLLAGIYRNDGAWLVRHQYFYMEGQEWANAERTEFPIRFGKSLYRLGKDILPFQAYTVFDDYDEIRLEATSLVLAGVGVAASVTLLGRQSFAVLLLPSILLALGIAASSPTQWRESAMFAPLLLMAGIGIEAIWRWTRRYRFSYLLIVTIMLTHIAIFSVRFSGMYLMITEKSPVRTEGLLGKELYRCLAEDIAQKRTIYLPNELYTRIFKTLSMQPPPFEMYNDAPQPSPGSVVVFHYDPAGRNAETERLLDSSVRGHSISSCDVPSVHVSLPIVRF